MSDPLTTISTRATPQSQPAEPAQVENSAGGYTFTVDDMARLRRFLILGTTGGTYYVGERELTKDTAGVVLDLARSRGSDVVAEVVAVSTAGRAPRQNPALFTLAAVAALGDLPARQAAAKALPAVARTGTHLFVFAGYVEQFRGWGRSLRRAISSWYTDKTVDDLAYQAVKYRQREGWSHRDLLRLAHPKAVDGHRDLFDWICGRDSAVPRLVEGFQRAQASDADLPALIGEYGLSWEMLPTTALNRPAVWEALLDAGVPQTALIRQLPRLTRLGVLAPMSPRTARVAAHLSDPTRLARGRVHPLNVLVALRTYASGSGARGSGEWAPVREIVDALDSAFYAAFGAVEPTGKRTLLALDVSGSMGSPVAGLPITCREATAALALVTASVEPSYSIVGFTSTFSGSYGWSRDADLTPLAVSPRQRLDDAIRAVSNLPFGGTDCSLPMRWALETGLPVDTFIVLTDNETWAGPEHPHQALRRYRERTGIPARLVVVAMTPTRFSIADPADPGMLDMVGFDTATPNLISDFSRGAA